MRLSFPFLLIASLLTVQSMGFSQNPATGSTIKFDTIPTGWTEAAPGKIISLPFKEGDTKGNIYAYVEFSGSDGAYCMLQNGRWKSLDEEMQTRVAYLESDIQGTVYAVTTSAVYKNTGSLWKKIAGDSTVIFSGGKRMIEIYHIQPEGGIIAVKKQGGDWNQNRLIQWDGKRWMDVVTSQGAILFTDRPEITVDKKGTIYYAKNKSGILYSITGTQVKEARQMPDEIDGLGTSAEGWVYAFGGYDAKFFFKKWDGTNWTDISMPAGLKDPRSQNNDWLLQTGKLYVYGTSAETNAGRYDNVIFKYEKGIWVRLGSYDSRLSNYEKPAIVKGTLYLVSQKTKALQHWQNGNIIRREVYPFVYAPDVDGDGALREKLADLRLIREGGKFGVIHSTGKTIIYPAFDQVILTKDPYEKSKIGTSYSFKLTHKGVSYYTPFYNLKEDPSRLPTAYEEKRDKCSKCNGRGSLGGINTTETKNGKWVEGCSTTTTRPSTMGGYQQTIITTPGYREPSTTVVTGKTASSNCSSCRGNGFLLKGWREYLVFNGISKSYQLVRTPISE